MSTIESRLRERIAFLEEQIRQFQDSLKVERDPLALIGITGQQAIALAVLMRGGTRTRRAIEAAIETVSLKVEPRDCRHVDVVVSRLRKTLRPHGVEIRNVYGQGYYLDHDSNTRIHALCAAERRLDAPRARDGMGEDGR